MPVDIQKTKEKLAAMKSADRTGWKPRYGKSKTEPTENKIKLFSWPPDGGELAFRVMKHFNLGADGKKVVICPKTFGAKNPCCVCTESAELTRSEDASCLERAKKLMSTERYLQLVADWNQVEEKPDASKQILIYDCPPKVHRDIMQLMTANEHDFTAWDSALGALTCFEQGTGKPKSVTFSIPMRNMKPIEVSLPMAEWMILVPDLKSAVQPPTPERLLALLNGTEDDEPETAASTAAAAAKNPNSVLSTPDPSTQSQDPNWVAETPAQPATPAQIATTTTPATTGLQSNTAPRKSLTELMEAARKAKPQ